MTQFDREVYAVDTVIGGDKKNATFFIRRIVSY